MANRIELGQVRAGLVVSCESAREINDTMIESMLQARTMEQFKQALTAAGMPGWLGDVVRELYDTFPGLNDAVRNGVAEATGEPARSFEQFVRDHAGLFR